MKDIDWSEHQRGIGEPVRCYFTPRPEYNGQRVRDDVLQFAGNEYDLVALWRIEPGERYEGEWALGSADLSPVAGRLWIASGDVHSVEWVRENPPMATP